MQRASFDRAAAGIAHVGLDGRFLRVNDALCRLLGYSRAELLGLTYREVTAPDDLDASIARFDDLLHGETEVTSIEKRFRRKDGSIIWASITTTVVFAGPNAPKHFVSVIVNIEDRKRAEREVERQAWLLDHAYDAIFSWELDGAITYWNQGASRLYGYDKHEAVGQAPHRLLQTRHPVPMAEYRAALLTAGRWEGELIHVDKLGREIAVESRAVLFGGDVPFVIEANRDITAQTAVQHALQVSEEQFRLLAESLPQVVFTADDRGEFDYVNSGWLLFTGLTLAESLGVGWTQFIHPTDRDAVVVQWREAVASGEPFEAEFRLRAARGGYRWFLAKAVAVRDRNGRIFRWVGAGTDITERHRFIDSLKRSEARFRRLFDANLFGVVFWSERGEIVDANDAFLTMLGYGRDALESGRLRGVALAPDGPDAPSGPYETWFAHRDGHRVPVIVAEAESPGDQGEHFTIVVDLSEREARERFEQEFLADVAHDLRNPLAATKAQAQVMRRRLKANRLEPDSLEEGLETIIANSTRMARRIEELTDVAQLRAGHALELDREPVDLVAMAQSSVEIYRQATERKEMRVETALPSLVGLWDAGRLERVIDNLLSNAVKYSPEGGPIVVGIDLIPEERAGGQAQARLTVRDQGVGIPAVDRAAIFERFQRGSNVKGRVGGSGIGLAGANTIVKQHGGAIAVESELGAGSVFTVVLPLKPPEAGQ